MNDSIRRGIDRYTLMSDLAPGLCRLISRSIFPLGVVVALVSCYLVFNQSQGGAAFLLMGIGTLVVFSIWGKQGIGLPLLPVIAFQHLFAYGLPIITGNETTQGYPDIYMHQAGAEVLLFLLTLGGGWRFGMQSFRPARPIAHTLTILAKEGSAGLRRIGYLLITFTSAYYVLQGFALLELFTRLLPSGHESILNALVSAAGMCGFFVLSLGVASGEIPTSHSAVFWGLFTLNCLISASGLLMSASTIFVIPVFIGLFWGSGRVPWKFTIIVLCILGFLNLGKSQMRERYWHIKDENIETLSISALPARYIEWSEVSMQMISLQPEPSSRQSKAHDTSLFSRINNLQNLLFVIDAMDAAKIPPLYGKTYSLIPPLLIPRIFWSDKPRSHEGQVMLNVHFNRQDLESSYRTYIAWGLLPEAYGNFGAFFGSALLGGILGLFIAWVENLTAQKPLLSLEGFLAFTLFLGMAASFEMVASVLVTTIFQSLVPVWLACLPFVYRFVAIRPVDEANNT